MQPIPPFFILVGIADESFVFEWFGHKVKKFLQLKGEMMQIFTYY